MSRFAKGSHTIGSSETRPEVRWQIPAIGDRQLTPEQARILASDIERMAEENDANCETLEFILLDEDPSDVAENLREEADRAEQSVEDFKQRVEEDRRRREAEQ